MRCERSPSLSSRFRDVSPSSLIPLSRDACALVLMCGSHSKKNIEKIELPLLYCFCQIKTLFIFVVFKVNNRKDGVSVQPQQSAGAPRKGTRLPESLPRFGRTLMLLRCLQHTATTTSCRRHPGARRTKPDTTVAHTTPPCVSGSRAFFGGACHTRVHPRVNRAAHGATTTTVITTASSSSSSSSSSNAVDDAQPPAPLRKVTIIGGGMAGLGCLHALSANSPHALVTLVEAGRHLGGRVCTRTAIGAGSSNDIFRTTRFRSSTQGLTEGIYVLFIGGER